MCDDGLRVAIAGAMGRDDVRAVVEDVYRAIESRLAELRPGCEMSGSCCRFEEYGHRLYVTTAELAVFATQVRGMPELTAWLEREDGGGCRYQEARLCMAHAIRPMGCRLYFCDRTKASVLQSLYEQMHRQLQVAHEQLAVPYRYAEWRQGLTTIRGLLKS